MNLSDTTISTISFRSVSISQDGSLAGSLPPITRGSSQRPILMTIAPNRAFWKRGFRNDLRFVDFEYLYGKGLMLWLRPSSGKNPFEIRSLRHNADSIGITPSKKSCKISGGESCTGWRKAKCLLNTDSLFTPFTLLRVSFCGSSSTNRLCCSTVLKLNYLALTVVICLWRTKLTYVETFLESW